MSQHLFQSQKFWLKMFWSECNWFWMSRTPIKWVNNVNDVSNRSQLIRIDECSPNRDRTAHSSLRTPHSWALTPGSVPALVRSLAAKCCDRRPTIRSSRSQPELDCRRMAAKKLVMKWIKHLISSLNRVLRLKTGFNWRQSHEWCESCERCARKVCLSLWMTNNLKD